MHRAVHVVALVVAILCTTACFIHSPRQVESKGPDRVLFDRATKATQQKRFTVANLTLQTLVNTYPNSQYAHRRRSCCKTPRLLDVVKRSQPLYANRKAIRVNECNRLIYKRACQEHFSPCVGCAGLVRDIKPSGHRRRFCSRRTFRRLLRDRPAVNAEVSGRDCAAGPS